MYIFTPRIIVPILGGGRHFIILELGRSGQPVKLTKKTSDGLTYIKLTLESASSNPKHCRAVLQRWRPNQIIAERGVPDDWRADCKVNHILFHLPPWMFTFGFFYQHHFSHCLLQVCFISLRISYARSLSLCWWTLRFSLLFRSVFVTFFPQAYINVRCSLWLMFYVFSFSQLLHLPCLECWFLANLRLRRKGLNPPWARCDRTTR